METPSTSTPRSAYTVQQFCEAHNFTRVLFYKLMKSGHGPRIMKVGTRTLISVEAAADWRRQMEEGATVMPSRRGKR
ncbi:hypothetical protein SAMN05421829_10726 [Aromatoleum tolulyticum]|uniref:Helix-turn-helix domain-containing protein n=1 Tax=Aromatoleum tolulyticum TaxID=34027 RepID=A0A1N6VUW8_9RHOO|nr:hypothetical protein SAMN05421829_10726 [Aromatoleum tolulyticum]